VPGYDEYIGAIKNEAVLGDERSHSYKNTIKNYNVAWAMMLIGAGAVGEERNYDDVG
jgi:hypothetical protein